MGDDPVLFVRLVEHIASSALLSRSATEVIYKLVYKQRQGAEDAVLVLTEQQNARQGALLVEDKTQD